MIVECPACQNRYDVEGRTEGTRARCRCGEVFAMRAVEPEILNAAPTQPSPYRSAPPMLAGMLACPKCAAPVPEASHRCEFCATPLMVKACTRCLTRMFQGYEHCPHCGAHADSVAAASAHRSRTCPRCETALVAHLISDIAVDDCARCGGVFIDRPAIERLITDRQQARADELLGAYHDISPFPEPTGEKMYVRCPDCTTMMNRKQFARGAKVIVDVCRDHGTWFDKGELPRVVDFVMHGGLETAQKLAVEEKRDEAKRAASDARYAAATASHQSGQFGVISVDTRADAALSLLHWLWR